MNTENSTRIEMLKGEVTLDMRQLDYNYIFLFSIPIVIAMILVFFWTSSSISLVPLSDKFDFIAYSDSSEDGGNTSILSKKIDSQSGIELEYILRSGYEYPYAGFRIFPKDRSSSIDLSKYRKLKLSVKTEPMTNLSIHLYTFMDGVSKEGIISTYRVDKVILNLKPDKNEYYLNIKDFEPPNWWLKQNNLDIEDLKPVDWSTFSMLAITESDFHRLNSKGKFHFTEISFERDYNVIVILYTVFMFFYYIFIAFSFYKKGRGKRIDVLPLEDPGTLVNSIDPKTIEIIEFIAENFKRSDLDISKVASQVNLSATQINLLIKKYCTLTFAQYLQKIRIAEAKRLLLETDRRISEIADLVGFSSLNHFSRAFRNYVGIPPTKFRTTEEKPT